MILFLDGYEKFGQILNVLYNLYTVSLNIFVDIMETVIFIEVKLTIITYDLGGVCSRVIISQGGHQTLETLDDPEKPWILFALGKIPWKTLKFQPTP